MDMSSSMSMSMAMGTTAIGSAMPASTGAAAGGMSMGGDDSMGMGNGCKISMLWNWYTVDACFISSTWQITSPGMFAGSCIGVILLVMSLAFLRRFHRAYDAYVARSLASRHRSVTSESGSDSDQPATKDTLLHRGANVMRSANSAGHARHMRPSVFQQAIRAFLHMVQFAVAYFVMLLAMYYNGYIIICILIGAFLGYFVFEWEPMTGPSSMTAVGATETTGCCG